MQLGSSNKDGFCFIGGAFLKYSMSASPHPLEKRYTALRSSIRKTDIPLLMKLKRGQRRVGGRSLRLAREFLENYDVALNARPATEHVPNEVPINGRMETADYVWFKFLPNGKAQLGIGDITTHGSRAAQLRKNIVSSISSSHRSGTHAVFAALHRLLESKKDILPAIHSNFDWRKGILNYANAAHPPAYLIRNGKAVRVMNSTNSFLGLDGDRPKLEKLQLHEGDRLLFLSDGLKDHQSASREILGSKRLEGIIERHAHLPLHEHADAIMGEMDRFGTKRLDDQTIFALEVKKALKPKA